MKNFTFILTIMMLFTYIISPAQNLLQILDPDSWGLPDDPSGKIEEAVISLEPRGIYTEVGMYLTISSEGTNFNEFTELEAVLDFNLPAGAIVHDSWLWMPDGQIIVQAEVLDISRAWQTYEDIVDRNRDPSILYRKDHSNYQIRIFPMFQGESRKIKITYLSPNEWDPEHIKTWLPADILSVSEFPIDKIKIIHIPHENWKNPMLIGLDNNEFVSGYDPVFGDIQYLELSNEDLKRPLRYQVDAPFGNKNYFVSQFEDSEDKFYQLAYLPPIQPESQDEANLMVLMDHYGAFTSHDQPSIVEGVKQALGNYTNGGSQFKYGWLGNSQLEFSTDDWQPLSESNIESNISAMTTASNTSLLLKKAVQQAIDDELPVDIVLVSSGNNIIYWNAESEADDILELIGTHPIRIHVIDFQTSSYFYYSDWDVPTILMTNHKRFYEKISTYTHGSFESVFAGGFNIWDMCDQTFKVVFSKEQDFDLHVKLEQGFTFDRYQVNRAEVNPLKPILQIGKFNGNFPMEIEFSGVDDNGFVYEEEWISESNTSVTDSLTREMWVGSEIKYLEGAITSFADVEEIVEMSIEERVLSKYTAFLALDLENGGDICANCWEVGGDIFIRTTDHLESDEELDISAFPNPFKDITTITISSENEQIQEIQGIAIYDILGKKVKDFTDYSIQGNSKVTFSWNGLDNANVKLNTGIYFLVVSTDQKVYNLNLSFIKD